ncbi:MAG: hypothetical protein D6808_03645 [Candidatus Dadabacteria bacterium]|nr:MAG: hypothetical protein D6808_03645 [Candidatus Dadabacteria bacterium]
MMQDLMFTLDPIALSMVTGVCILVEAFLLWVVFFLTRIKCPSLGLLILAAAIVVPHIFLSFSAAIVVGSIIFWILATKVSSADGLVDIILPLILINVTTYPTLSSIIPHILDLTEKYR